MRQKWLNSFTVALLLTLISLYCYSLDLNFFQLLEFKGYDIKVRLRGSRPLTNQVVIVAIDEKSLQEEGRWPWPRFLMGKLVDQLSSAGAATIAFDIFFPEKETSVPLSILKQSIQESNFQQIDRKSMLSWLEKASDSDKQFALAIERSQRVVLSYFVYPTQNKAGATGENLNDSYYDALENSQYAIVQRSDSEKNPAPLRSIYSLGMNLPELTKASKASGFVSFIPEVDGVIRWVPMVMEFKQTLFPPLNLQALHQATQLPLGARIAPYGVSNIRLGDSDIPTAENGDFLVNFYGPAYTFTHLSATDVLSGKVGAAELENKIVIVGVTAAGAHDIHTSPYGPLYPGVEVHANIIESVLQNDFLKRPDWLRILDVGMILGSGLLFGLFSLFFKPIAQGVVLACGIGGYLVVDYYLFSHMGLWVNSVYPVVNQIFVFSGIIVYRFAFEEQEKRFIKKAFGQYLAPAVVNRLMDNPSLLKLGGERKVLTAFFSDVAGFSTISEKLSPEELVELLNIYLTEMTDIILKYEGTVDKFEGDAIIAFFGAPVSYEDHARRACFVSIEMHNRLKALREQWKKEGKQQLFMRIGLNTGPMIIGNMGSKSRMDYTIMGDSVNLASRLEGVNKMYGTHSMISEFTYAHAKDHIEAREIDMIRVVGKTEPVRIYELLGKKGELDEQMKQILPVFAEGLQYYRNQQWKEAIDCFEKALAIKQDDNPSLTYFERCLALQNNPPPSWDGVFTMTSK